jgi:threonine/homoserine/homoserine lactone efflux protein
MSIELWLAFVAASAVLLVIPGPTILTVISYSLAQGRRATVPLVAAVALGDSTALALSLLGLGAVLASSAFWFGVVKTAGGLYLIYLGVRLFRRGVASAEITLPSAPGSRRRLFANTWLVTALNPKGIVFFVAFLPQFVSPGAEAARHERPVQRQRSVFLAQRTIGAHGEQPLAAALAPGADRDAGRRRAHVDQAAAGALGRFGQFRDRFQPRVHAADDVEPSLQCGHQGTHP